MTGERWLWSSCWLTANPEVTPKRQNGGYFRIAHNPPRNSQDGTESALQCGCRLVSKQAAVASVVFVDVQTTLFDNLGSSSQCCCDGRIANVWQRLDENFLDFFQCEAVIEPGPHVDGEFVGLTHGNHDRHRN